MKRLNLKNKKGFTFAQVLLYTVLAIIIFTAFFSLVAGLRGNNLNFIDKSDILYQASNMDDLVNNIRYATDITYVCSSMDTTCDNTRIKFTNKDGLYEKEYSYDMSNKSILVTDNANTNIPQYTNIESITFKKITNSIANIKVIEVDVKFKKNNVTYSNKIEIFPISWLDKTVGVNI